MEVGSGGKAGGGRLAAVEMPVRCGLAVVGMVMKWGLVGQNRETGVKKKAGFRTR